MEIDGYELVAPLGRSQAGTVWRVRDGSGRAWAAKLVRADAGERADRFARGRLCGIVAIAPADLGRVGVISKIREGDDLGVLARDESWRGDHARSAIHKVACQLARIHAAGLAHGDVSAANIHATRSGVALIDPLLDEAEPTPHYRAPERAVSLAADVYALGILARDLGVSAPILTRACDADPTKRPAARHIARALADVDTPVRTRRPEDTPAPPPQSHDPIRAELTRPPTQRTQPVRSAEARRRQARGRNRRGLLATVIGIALIGAGAATLLWPSSSQATPAAAEKTTQQAATRDVLADHVRALITDRDAALARGNREKLAALTAPDSPARAEDDALADALAAADIRLEGLATKVGEVVREPDAPDGGVVVSVHVQQQAYRRCQGSTCEDVPAQPGRTVRITLTGERGAVRSIDASG
ncbi:hypothetical protein H8R18_03690 [Nanchangia anserum]|uniref:Protein kinase domain-containing protein n=1 Tax=Nanchangia anserum TaxID=2692125 RepID=A0A8I0G9F6_9ACTO|nr:hypothetical protein [Nanchangia anserum]MBD3688663.1 hypothetical protein [Nanchangia anserum]QOX82418.1 hypothetical protein H8R18_03690 [Nanchangia anserum]